MGFTITCRREDTEFKVEVGHLIKFERIRTAAKSEGVLGFDITQMPLYVVQKYEYHGRYRLVANVLEQLKNNVEYYAQANNTI